MVPLKHGKLDPKSLAKLVRIRGDEPAFPSGVNGPDGYDGYPGMTYRQWLIGKMVVELSVRFVNHPLHAERLAEQVLDTVDTIIAVDIERRNSNTV